MTGPRPGGARQLVLLGRLAGAGLLAATAGIHLHLWQGGYDRIPWVGPLFLVDAAAAALLALAVLLAPARRLPVAAWAGMLLQLGTLTALALAVSVGLFGFVETSRAPLSRLSIWVETCGAVVLLLLTLVPPRPARSRSWSRSRSRSRGRLQPRPVRAG